MLGLMLSVPATASAAAAGRPTGCTQQVSGSRMTVARCDESNGGHYRAVAVCKDTDTGAIKLFDGDWRNNGSWSKAYCQGSTIVQSAGIETKVT
ncbi:hypothetical protein GCM10010415_69390 [Streptomyces atrovirens]